MKYRSIEELIDSEHNHIEGYNPLPPDYMDEDIIYVSSMERLPEVYSSKIHVNVLCFVKNGNMEVEISGERTTVCADDLLACPSNVVVDHMLVSPDFKFSVLAISDRYLQDVLSSNMDVWTRAMYLRKARLVRPTSEEERMNRRLSVWHAMEFTKLMLRNQEAPLHREIVRSMINTVLLSFCAIQKDIEKNEGAVPEGQTSQQGRLHFNRFMQLLNNESRKYRPVKDYASRLNITPKHLTFVCEQMCGKTASEIIQASVTEEIVRHLRNTALSVKQITMIMGFANVSAFGKYVKTHLGVSPNEYRRRLMTQ